VDPILYWKGHSGRWIADAKFIPGPIISTSSSNGNNNNAQPPPPSRLVTAGNDGTICLWDLSTVSISTGIPKLLHRTGKSLHTSGIFCMDVTSYTNNNYNDLMICTGSKDKSIAISSLESLTNDATGGTPIWTSRFHTAKVGSVKLQSPISTMLASASDDGSVGIHDYRMNGNNGGGSSSLVAKLDNAHARPHSVLWDPYNETMFVTAGLDPIIKVWDQRNLSKPILCLQGHVPSSTGSRCKKIHRPTFFYPGEKGTTTTTIEKRLLPNIEGSHPFLLTGGQGSTSVSMYQIDTATTSASLFSRGKLPIDCGNAGCIAVNGKQVAVTVDQGEIIILEPSSSSSSSSSRS
jgi:WD40 repeat protein